MQTTKNATPNTLETFKKAIDMSERHFIATMAMQGILSNPTLMQASMRKIAEGACNVYEAQELLEKEISSLSLQYADAVIAKSKETS